MANGWTTERQARQAELIKNWRPWERSTGPTTDEGKAVASRNTLKHGLRSAEWLEEQRRVNDVLRRCREQSWRELYEGTKLP